MRAVIATVVVAMLGGFAIARFLAPGDLNEFVAANTPSSFDSTAPVAERIAALEHAVSEERAARQLLEDQLIFLMDERGQLEPAVAERVEIDDVAVVGSGDDTVSRRGRRNMKQTRAERLVEAGFDPARAQWVLQRESELQMEALRARYEAGRSGDTENYYQRGNELRNALREDLGDADYEKYLAANGNNTEITVSMVLDSSPAQTAGMQQGDRIVRYDGKRIFSMYELTEQTMQGTAGENVVLNILRDGVPMQIVLPRGPLGVTGGR